MASLRETSDEDKVRGKTNGTNNKSSTQFQSKSKPHLKDTIQKSGNKIKSANTQMNQATSNMIDSPSANAEADDISSKGLENAGSVGKHGVKAIKKAPSNIKSLKNTPQRIKQSIQNMKKKAKERKRIKQVKAILRKIRQLVIAFIKIIIKLIMTFWWAIAMFVGVSLFSYLLFSFLNNASIRGNYFIDGEVVSEYNITASTDNADIEITEVTMENKLVRAFYYYFAEKSIWIMTDGSVTDENGTTKSGKSTDGKAVQFRSKEYIDLFGDPDKDNADVVKDKYSRESEFYINPNALYVLDKYLHDSKFRFPEQIVKHVAYEKNPDYVEEGSTGGGTGVISGNGNEQICWNYYRSVGFTEEQTAGLLGNIYTESSFKTTATNGSHWGIHQWGGGRYAALQKLAATKGKAWTDLEVQLEFAVSELNGAYKSSLNSAGWNKSGLSATEAADIIRLKYEICGEQGAARRREYAQKFYNQFKGTSAGTSTDTNNNNNTTNNNQNSANVSTAYASWKQADSRWGNLTLGSSSTKVSKSGCLATSACVLAAYSGAASKDESKFNPGIGIPQLSFNGPDFCWESISALGDKSLTFVKHGETTNKETLIKEVKSNVENGKFYIVHVTGHYMPVIGVTDNDILINDVGGQVGGKNTVTITEYLKQSSKSLLGYEIFKSSKTNMKECGNVSYNGSSDTSSVTSVNTIPYRLKQLTDDDGNVCVESTKYKMEKVTEKVYKKEESDETIKKSVNISDIKTDKKTGEKVVKGLPKTITVDKDGKEVTIEKQDVTVSGFDPNGGHSTKADVGNYYAKYTVHYIKEVDTGRTVQNNYWVKTDEKTKGIWDYGFGSIVFYNKYIEKEYNKGSIKSFTYWDPNKKNDDGSYGAIITCNDPSDYNSLSEDKKASVNMPFDLNNEYEPWDEEKSESYMIKWAITPAGSITNGIDYSEVNTGEQVQKTDSKSITVTKLVPKTKKESYTVYKGDPGLPVATKYDKNNIPIENSYVTLEPEIDENGNQKSETTKEYNVTRYYQETQTITLTASIEGYRYSLQPNYKNEKVDLSGITGTRYYKDYLYHYNGYVPLSVQGTFNFNDIKKRTGLKNDKDLNKILGNSTFEKKEDTSLEFFDTDGTYNGIGSIQVHYETGSKIGDADVGHYEHDGYYPGWGFANFTPENCTSFMKWLKKKDATFYNKYFGGVSIEPNGGKNDFYRAWKACATTDKEKFTEYYSSFSYKNDCYDSVLKSKKITGNPILGQIDFARSFALQEMTYSIACAGPAVALDVLQHCGIQANDSDATIIKKMGTYLSTPSVYQRWYKTRPDCWKGVVNRWSPSKKNSQTSTMLKYIENNGDVVGFEYDEDSEMLVANGSSSNTKEGLFKKMTKWLKSKYENFKDFVSDILLGQEYTDVLEDKYWTKLQGGALADNQANWVLAAMFAYEDEDKITEYDIDDDYFKLKFQQLFSSEGITGSGATVLDRYFSGTATNPLKEDSSAKITVKYNAKVSPVIQMSVKKGTKIKTVANGKVIKTGYDSKYGGAYIMIQHSGCVSIYGHLNTNTVQKGATVKEGTTIGESLSKFYFAMRTKPKGTYINPTLIIEGGGDSTFTGTYPANGMKIPLYIQGDYPQPIFQNGSSIAKSGCGFTSCAMVASYLTNKTILPTEIVNKFKYKYYLPGQGMDWGLPAAVAKEYNLGKVTETSDPNLVLKALSAGKPVLSSQGPGIFTSAGHIIVLRGTDGNGNVYVNDPNSRERSQKTFNFKTQVHSTAKHYWIFEGK